MYRVYDELFIENNEVVLNTQKQNKKLFDLFNRRKELKINLFNCYTLY